MMELLYIYKYIYIYIFKRIGEKNIVHRNKAMSMKMLQHIFLSYKKKTYIPMLMYRIQIPRPSVTLDPSVTKL
jgi:hypothetical protein